MNPIFLRILETPEELHSVEALQRQIWPGNETDVVPMHLLITAAHNGGLVIGAYNDIETSETMASDPKVNLVFEIDEFPRTQFAENSQLVGFVFGFLGIYETPDGPRLKHCSHMMGVLPEYRDRGIGFSLKRAQWQMIRHQGIDRITWTYDPLLSRNALLNISRLGSVCSIYIREAYGEMKDELNIGLPSDRFQVDWWVNSLRVKRRLSKRPRKSLDLAHFLAADTSILNPSGINADGLPKPSEPLQLVNTWADVPDKTPDSLLLLEIPSDFMALKTLDPLLAREWRIHTRCLFEELFKSGYLVTDFVYLPGGSSPKNRGEMIKFPGRSFYVLSNGESTL